MTGYALSISDIEVERYRLMAEMARELEATHGNWRESFNPRFIAIGRRRA